MGVVKLGDVARESRLKWTKSKQDVPIVGLEHLIPDEIRFDAYDINTDNTFSKRFVKGQVLFGRRRAYQRKAAIAEFDGICSGDITVIQAIERKMVPELLPFIIQTPVFFDYANRGSAGSLSPRVKWEHLADYEFELPPLEEQKILADKLWAAYRLKEAYKKLLVATDEMVKSQFIEMFGNPLSLNQKNELKRLGECCILNPRRPNIALCDTDKVSFIPMPAVSEDGYWVDMTDEEYGKVKKGFTYFENNDVLFAKITPCMENGKGAIVHGLTNGIGMGSTEFHVLRPINGISSPYWLLALTRMPIFRERAAKNMSGTGGQKRVSASYLDHFMVGLPAIEEQRRFEAIYRQADKSKFGDFKSQFIEMFGNCKSQGTLSSLCATFIDGDWIESKDQSDNGIRLIQTGNVGFGFFKGREDKSRYITEETFKKLNCTEVVPGDILISRLPDPIGRACIVPEGIGKAITAVDCTIVRLNATLLPEFLISFSKTALYASQINKIKTGTTRLRVSRGNLGNVIIPIPPIESQHHFAAIAQQADKSKSVIQKALVYLNDIQSDELRKIA